MAPEQARGMAVDGRADLFSLGCVLYAMLTGERPFRGEHDHEPADGAGPGHAEGPRREVDPDCPPELSRLTMHLLEKEPGKRPASAREVVDALAKIRGTADAHGGDRITGEAEGRPEGEAAASAGCSRWWPSA